MVQYCPIHMSKVKNDPGPLNMYWKIFNKELISGNHKFYCLNRVFSPKEPLVQLTFSSLFYFCEQFTTQVLSPSTLKVYNMTSKFCNAPMF